MEVEESEDSQEIRDRIASDNIFLKSPKKLAEHLSRYKTVTKEMVIKILYTAKKIRTDVENRMVADYLSKNFEYFSSIKENNQSRFLKLIAVLNFEHYLPGNIIMDLSFEEDKFFIVFDGLVQVFRQFFYTKEMTLGNFTNYLNYIKNKDEKRFFRIIEQNKHMGMDFKNIKDNVNFERFEHKKFIFTLEEQEEIGKFSEGYIFGEMNLMRKKKVNLIVKCIKKTEVISVSKFDFNRILKTYEEKRLELLSERFRKKFNTFKFWSMEQLITLFNYFSKVVFLKDEYIYKQNEPSKYIYFIEKGKFEQYSNTNYYWYKDYIEYIGEVKSNLINLIIEKKMNSIADLKEIYHDKVKNQEEIDNLVKKNKIQNLLFLNLDLSPFEVDSNLKKYIKKDNLYSIKKEEEDLNDPNLILHIPILTTEMPKIVGMEEPFELKKRFTSVKCISGKLVAQRIKVYDLLKLLLIFKEFKYPQNFLNVIVQRKLILIEAMKKQMKLISSKFEKQINYKYNILINQNDDKDQKFAAVKLKGWNNGIYLDNILDTNLYLFKPKTERFINKEREKRYRIIKALSEERRNKNIKKTNITYLKFYDENKFDSILLSEQNDYLSQKTKRESSSRKGQSNEKSYSSTKFNKKKLITIFQDIENNNSQRNTISNHKRKFINKENLKAELNTGLKKYIKDNHINKLNLKTIFSNFDTKNPKNKNRDSIPIGENLFVFTRPSNTYRRSKHRNNYQDHNFRILMSALEKESNKKFFVKNHKFDKKAFPAIFYALKRKEADDEQ